MFLSPDAIVGFVRDRRSFGEGLERMREVDRRSAARREKAVKGASSQTAGAAHEAAGETPSKGAGAR